MNRRTSLHNIVGAAALVTFALCVSPLFAQQRPAVANWSFDGDLRDSSKHNNHLTGQGVDFVCVDGGQALKSSFEAVQAPSNPSLQLAPGSLIDCSVYFEQAPDSSTRYLVSKKRSSRSLVATKSLPDQSILGFNVVVFFRHGLLRPVILHYQHRSDTFGIAGKNRLRQRGEATWEGIFRPIAGQWCG